MIAGTVRDVATGELLPGATIQVKGTFVGTVSNESGVFRLDVLAVPVTLVTRFIGYDSDERSITESVEFVDIRLEPSVFTLPELVVSGEDPAVGIMRRVIAEKKIWKKNLHSYRVEAYNRFRMENDSGIVSIWESGTLAFWDEKRGSRELSIWQKQTDNMEIENLLPAALFVKNLYDDDVELAGHRLMGVTHPDALDYYLFHLIGSRSRDGRLVYDIEVRPRSRLSSGFKGRIAVLDSVFAILNVDLSPDGAFFFPPPIKDLRAEYHQQFSRFSSSVWLPADYRASLALDIAFSGLLSFPTIRIEQLSRLTNFVLNVAPPDSLYERSEFVIRDTTALKKIKVSAPEVLSVPLTERELAAYSEIDSSMTVAKAFKPKGLLARFVEVSNERDESRRNRKSGSGFGKGGILMSLDASPMLWYNRVEGLFTGLSVGLRPAGRTKLEGSLGYSEARKDWSWGAQLSVGRRYRLQTGYSDRVARRYVSRVHSRLTNSMNVVAFGRDYFDYLKEEKYFARLSGTLKKNRSVRWELEFAREKHRNVSTRIKSSILGQRDDIRTNAPVSEGVLRTGTIRLSYEGDSVPYGIGPEYSVDLLAETSIGSTLSTLPRFSRYTGSVVWRFPTFYRRRFIPNSLDFRITAGTFAGTLPRQRFGIVDGTSTLSIFGGLRTRLNVPYEGSSYVSLVWEHNFRSVPFEILGWTAAARNGLNLIVFGGHARTWNTGGSGDAESLRESVSESFHHEIGWSVSGLFSLFRIDFARRLDRSDFTIGVSAARIF
jgi:Family of unknown function (DUF5686)/CarboxypepD_reg-like domain